MSYATGPVLVVAPIDTPAQRRAARAYALAVATEFVVPTMYATHSDVSVTDFTEVHCPSPILGAGSFADLTPVVLVAEALALLVPVYERQSTSDNAECVCGQEQTVRTVYGFDGSVWCATCATHVGCAHCGQSAFDEELSIVEDGSTFVPLCVPCVDGFRQSGRRVKVATC